MGDLWRSEEMQRIQLFLQIEAAHDTIDELGQLGLVQFRDLNPHVNAFQRNFVNEVKRADEMERKMRFYEAQVVALNQEAKERGLPKIRIEEAQEATNIHMDELENKFEDLEKQLLDMVNHNEQLRRNQNQLKELKHVLEKDERFFAEANQEESILMGGDEDDETRGLTSYNKSVGFISGVIVRSELHVFEKILFRATRGNLFMKKAEIEEDLVDASSGKMTQKNVFIIFFLGDHLRNKIKKICETFSASIYPCPATTQERKGLLDQVTTRLTDLKTLLDKGWEQRCQAVQHIATHLSGWKLKVMKEKSIYHTMNKFNYDIGRKCLIADGWCPVNAIEAVQLALRTGRERSGALIPSILNVIPTTETPPTYFKTNKFTSGFQAIVDSYGVARYREVNPTVFTIITFPFEFGVMFGDMGHGTMLLIFACILIYKEKEWQGKKLNEMIELPFGGRYVILLMALYSIFIGSLYNEFFAISLNFGSQWVLDYGPGKENNTFIPKNNISETVNSYAWGVDPIWKGASNELLYYNSLKMKTSIIIGVIQMLLGIILHLLNGIHFKKPLDIVFEFIPRFLFMSATFGYLVVMIFIKWNTNYMSRDIYNHLHNLNDTQTVGIHAGTAQAPILLNELIYMFLPGGPTNNPLYAGQYNIVQPILLGVALVSIPWMLLPKPLIILCQHRCGEKNVVVHHTDDEDDGSGSDSSEKEKKDDLVKLESEKPDTLSMAGGHGEHGEEFEFGEIMVHQGLETIEFVLGSVSHTASYLRLWALSLAHSELATVFWDKIMSQLITLTLESNLPFPVVGISIFAAWSAWFTATIVVLMMMEALSAFLHSLRLHWVEFQSKFYRGDGYPFSPFSYQRILEGAEQW